MNIERVEKDEYRFQDVKALLHTADLMLDTFDDFLVGYEQGIAVCCGALDGQTIKMVAIHPDFQERGYTGMILSSLVSIAQEKGYDDVFLFTKSSMAVRFLESGFTKLADTGEVVLFHRGDNGPKTWVNNHPAREAHAACIVMNANPMTNGHLALVKKAASENPFVLVFVVEENRSEVPFAVRYAIVKETLIEYPNVQVMPSGPYIISGKTFPTYFLKEASARSAQFAQLDLQLFKKYFIPAYGIHTRYVGEEPTDPATRQYNETMHALFEGTCRVIEVPRITSCDGQVISASRVRAAYRMGKEEDVKSIVPKATWEYLKRHDL